MRKLGLRSTYSKGLFPLLMGTPALVIWCLITSVTLVRTPLITWGLSGALVGLVFLQVPIYIWVVTTVLAATVSRFFVGCGFPSILNFVHYPLALGTVFVALTKGSSKHPIDRLLIAGLVTLLLLSFLSWSFNGGEIFRPFFSWLVFFEPLMIIYAILRIPCSPEKERFLWKVAFFIPFIQVPIGLWQAVTLGLADHVQGTFVGQGAGHHVMGATCLIGTLLCIAKGLTNSSPNKRCTWLFISSLPLLLAVLSDSKQMICAFFIALVVLISNSRKLRWNIAVVATPLIFFLAVLTLRLYPPLQKAARWTTVKALFISKWSCFMKMMELASDHPWSWLFGLGPGNTVSRVGFLSIATMPGSPIRHLGLTPAPTTLELLSDSPRWSFAWGSSVLTPLSSLLALLGDLGPIAMGLVLWLIYNIWQKLEGAHRWEGIGAKSAMVMAGILGYMYVWLEEPGFTLTVALVVGLSLISDNKVVSGQTSTRPLT